jgi:hypothetical protein
MYTEDGPAPTGTMGFCSGAVAAEAAEAAVPEPDTEDVLVRVHMVYRAR